jgi:hypothetical protein
MSNDVASIATKGHRRPRPVELKKASKFNPKEPKGRSVQMTLKG